MSQLTSIISQTSNEISDTNYQAWERSQQINDKIADDFFDYILGVQTYSNPVDGSVVELPSGYSNVWANSRRVHPFRLTQLQSQPRIQPQLATNDPIKADSIIRVRAILYIRFAVAESLDNPEYSTTWQDFAKMIGQSFR